MSTAVEELILPANVEAFYDAPIYARVNGYLKSWAHDIGDRVKAGEVLAVIDAPDLEQQVEQAKGDLGLSVAQAGLASITAKRWTALRDQKAVSLQSTDEKTHDLTAKSSAAAAAKANLDHLKALRSFLTLVAPFDGVVTARNTDIGALIDAGVGKRDLFRVADIHAMRIYTSVPQAYAAKMTMGLSARLLLPQYPGREFEAKVIANANAITLNSRTLLVQLLAENRDGALLPGAFGQIRFQLPPEGAPLSIPASALVFLNGKPQLATVDEQNRSPPQDNHHRPRSGHDAGDFHGGDAARSRDQIAVAVDPRRRSRAREGGKGRERHAGRGEVRSFRSWMLGLGLCLGLGGCNFAPQYQPPVVETPLAFKEAAGAGSEIAKASGKKAGARRAAMVFVGSSRSAAARTMVERL